MVMRKIIHYAELGILPEMVWYLAGKILTKMTFFNELSFKNLANGIYDIVTTMILATYKSF